MGPTRTRRPYFYGTQDGVKLGYAYGGGVEVAVPTHSFLNRFNVFHASGATMKVEYLHYNLGADNLDLPGRQRRGGPWRLHLPAFAPRATSFAPA